MTADNINNPLNNISISNPTISDTDNTNSTNRCRHMEITPRCPVVFPSKVDENGVEKRCTRPRVRVPKSKPAEYFPHCYRHGGKSEREAWQRHQLEAQWRQAELDRQADPTKADLLKAVDASPSTPTSPVTPNSNMPILASLPSHTPHANDSDNDTNPKARGRVERQNGPVFTLSPVQKRSRGGVPSQRGGVSFIPEERGLRQAYERVLANPVDVTLRESAALLNAITDQVVNSVMTGGAVDGRQLTTLKNLMAECRKLNEAVAKVEEMRQVQLTRQMLRVRVLQLVRAIRDYIPEEEKRRDFAFRVAEIFKGELNDTGDTSNGEVR